MIVLIRQSLKFLIITVRYVHYIPEKDEYITKEALLVLLVVIDVLRRKKAESELEIDHDAGPAVDSEVRL